MSHIALHNSPTLKTVELNSRVKHAGNASVCNLPWLETVLLLNYSTLHLSSTTAAICKAEMSKITNNCDCLNVSRMLECKHPSAMHLIIAYLTSFFVKPKRN